MKLGLFAIILLANKVLGGGLKVVLIGLWLIKRLLARGFWDPQSVAHWVLVGVGGVPGRGIRTWATGGSSVDLTHSPSHFTKSLDNPSPWSSVSFSVKDNCYTPQEVSASFPCYMLI